MGWFSALMERRALRAWVIIAVVGAMAAVLLVGMQAAQAVVGIYGVSLPGSQFEIENSTPNTLPGANLVLDTVDEDGDPGLAKDWANVPQGSSANGSEVRKEDKPTGSQDDSFGQGTKEDTAVPTVIDGSIPNNKSDLLNFGVTLETNNDGRFLHLFWHRVQEPTGTTNMDFEFNHATATSSNGVTPVREEGDVLIQYDLAQGGTRPQLFLSRWLTPDNGHTKADCQAANSLPCWSDKVDLTASGDATGSINNVAITDDPNVAGDPTDGLATGGTISPRTFGEASVDFDAVAGDDPCVGFGSAYLKSRASDSFTAALKDFIAPEPLNISQCGAIQVTKTAKHKDSGTSPNLGATFTVKQGTTTVGTITTDPATGKGCLGNLDLGTYTVSETSGPSGYQLDTDTETANVTTTGSCSSGFVNVSFENVPLTNITVSVDSQVPGGTNSTIDCEPPVGDPPPTPTAANGDGSLTLNNKVPDTYTCTIVVDP